MLYFILTMVNMYYLITKILKLQKKAFHLMMFTLMQATYCAVFASNTIKWKLAPYFAKHSARVDKPNEWVWYWIVQCSVMMFFCFTHSIFASKYWQLAQTTPNSLQGKFIYFGLLLLTVACTLTGILVKILPVIKH